MTTEKQAETKTAESNGTADVQGVRAPLAKVVPISEDRVDIFNPKRWTKEDVDTIKNAICPKGITDAEFKLFIMRCQASGMNPLLGEAFCIERNVKTGGTKENPTWGKVYQFTPGEQGMEARADDFPDYKGLRAAAVYSKDKIVIDASTGEISHQFNPAEDRGRLLGAWALAYREGRITPVEYLKIEEYIDTRNPKWNASPHTMIVKCARAAALRRAYPNSFNGVYVREELRDDVEEALAQEAAPKSTADALAERMKSTGDRQAELKGETAKPPSKASTATVDVVKQPPLRSVPTGTVKAEIDAIVARCEALKHPYDGEKLTYDEAYRKAKADEVDKLAKRAAGVISESSMEGKPRDPPVEQKLPHQVADEKKAAAAAEGPFMVFGGPEFRGKALKSLTGAQIVDLMKLGNDKLKSLDEKKAAKVQQNLSELKSEIERREREMLDEQEKPAREPGADDDID